MRKALLVFLIALATLATVAPGASGASKTYLGYGSLDIDAKGAEKDILSPGKDKKIRLWMMSKGKKRCFNSSKVIVKAPTVFNKPSLTDRTENNSYDVWITVDVQGTPGTRYKVTAECRDWLFTGYVYISSRRLAHSGAPVLPTAALGSALLLVGGLLLAGERRFTRREGRRRCGGTAAGRGSAATHPL